MPACFECGRPATQEHHAIPASRGGTKTIWLCDDCHDLVHGVEGERTDDLGTLIREGQQRAIEGIESPRQFRARLDGTTERSRNQLILVGEDLGLDVLAAGLRCAEDTLPDALLTVYRVWHREQTAWFDDEPWRDDDEWQRRFAAAQSELWYRAVVSQVARSFAA